MRILINVMCCLTLAFVASCATDPAEEVGTIESPEIKIGPGTGVCMHTGCSNQICSDQVVLSTCEWRPEYACYQKATCERQANGFCGFTPTPELTECLANTGDAAAGPDA